MSKDMKQGVVEAPDASDKISRKQFEKELGKLQVELTGCRLGSRTRGRASLWKNLLDGILSQHES